MIQLFTKQGNGSLRITTMIIIAMVIISALVILSTAQVTRAEIIVPTSEPTTEEPTNEPIETPITPTVTSTTKPITVTPTTEPTEPTEPTVTPTPTIVVTPTITPTTATPTTATPTTEPTVTATPTVVMTPTVTPTQGPIGESGTLTLLHNNDGESSLLTLQNGVEPGASYPITETVELDVGGVAAFKTLMDQEVAEAREQGNAVLSVYAGDTFLASPTLQCTIDDPDGAFYDAVAQRQMAYDAYILGNHEFDYSPDFLERFIRSFLVDTLDYEQPFLSANLDFSNEPNFADLIDEDGVIFDPVLGGRVIGGSLITNDSVTGQRFGIVGLTTPDLVNISSPRDVIIGQDIVNIAQAEIDRLYDQYGIRKIIFVSHLQSLQNDRELIEQLRRVDIAVAGGGDELLVNPDMPQALQLLPGEDTPSDDTYPIEVQDTDDRTIYIVTTAGNYKYLGRLDVTFDADGEVVGFISEESYPRRVIPESDVAATLGLTDAVAPDPAIVASVVEPLEVCQAELADTPVVRTEVALDVSRMGVRGTESNAGNLIADSFVAAYERLATENGLPAIDQAGNPVIALQNGGGIRQNAGDVLPVGGVVAGTISRLDTINVLPFDNFITVIQDVSPADLKQIFERSAATLPESGGQFMQVSGLRVIYNLDNPAQAIDTDGNVTAVGSRVQSLTLADGTSIVADGAMVDGAPNVTVVTNSFTARGGDNYPWLGNNPNQSRLFDGGTVLSYEQAWVAYLRTFPVEEGLPTIQDDDMRYQPGGEGRIGIIATRP